MVISLSRLEVRGPTHIALNLIKVMAAIGGDGGCPAAPDALFWVSFFESRLR